MKELNAWLASSITMNSFKSDFIEFSQEISNDLQKQFIQFKTNSSIKYCHLKIKTKN